MELKPILNSMKTATLNYALCRSMLLVRACGPFPLLPQHLLAVVVSLVSSASGPLRAPSRVVFQGVLRPLPLLVFVDGTGFVFRGEQG